MDPEFKRVLARVLMVGGVILIVGAGSLVIAFRAFGSEKKDGDFRASLLVSIVLAFVFLACVLLLRMSMLR